MVNKKLPEQIRDFSVCLNLSLDNRLFFPVCPAIYVLYNSPGDVLYIGRTKSLRYRFSRKRAQRWLVFYPEARIAWFPLPRRLHDLERDLIQLYKPRGNMQYNPTFTYERFPL